MKRDGQLYVKVLTSGIIPILGVKGEYEGYLYANRHLEPILKKGIDINLYDEASKPVRVTQDIYLANSQDFDKVAESLGYVILPTGRVASIVPADKKEEPIVPPVVTPAKVEEPIVKPEETIIPDTTEPKEEDVITEPEIVITPEKVEENVTVATANGQGKKTNQNGKVAAK